MDAETSRWKLDEEKEFYIVWKYLPQITCNDKGKNS